MLREKIILFFGEIRTKFTYYIIPTHLNVKADHLLWGRDIIEWHLPPAIAYAVFHLWGQLEVDLLVSSHTNDCQHYYT